MRKLYLLVLGFIFVSLSSNAQIAAWDFFGESSPATSAADVYNSNLDASNLLTRGAGAASSAASNSFRTTGFQNNGISTANTDYFQFTLSAAPGFKLSLSTIDARFNGTASFFASPGVTSQFAYSLDGTTFTLIGSAVTSTSLTMAQIDLTGVSALQNVAEGTTVTFRYYASGQTSTGGWGFASSAAGVYGLAIGGTVAPATSNSANSNIILNSSFTESTNINYSSFQATDITNANSVEVAQFIIQDGGGAADADALSTTLTALSMSISNSANIRRVAIYDGSTEVAEVAGGATVNFSSLNLVAPDDGSKTFSVRVTYNSTVTDNQQNVFTITSATADVAGSVFAAGNAGGAASSSAGDDNRIEVTADRLAFVQQPSNTGINAAMTPAVTVSANDVNGNRDLDFTESVRITSTGTLSGSPVDVAAVAGLATFSTLTHTANGTGLTLNAERTATLDWDVTSTAFTISTASSASDYFRSKTSGNWGSISTWESSADGNTWQDATLVPDANANTITIRNGHNVTVAATAGGDQLVVEAGATLTLNAAFTVADGTGTDLDVSGTVVNQNGTHVITGTIAFNANSLYQHSRNGAPVLTATWNPSSTVEILGVTSSQPTGLGQTFGNFTWNSTGQSANIGLGNPAGFTIAGNLTVTSTGGVTNRAFRFTAGTNYTISVGGNLVLNGGHLGLSSGAGATVLTVAGNVSVSNSSELYLSQGGSANSTLNIGGDLSINNGTITETGSGTGNLIVFTKTGTQNFTATSATLSNDINYTINSGSILVLNNNLPVNTGRTLTVDGTLNAGTNQITGAGNLAVNNEIRTSNANGLEATGTFALGGTITLGANSLVRYTGVNQVFSARTDYANVTIEGGGTKTLNGNASVSKQLNLTSGIVASSSTNMLTLTETASVNGGSDNSHVTGQMQVLTNSGSLYTFPIGNGTVIRRAYITPSTTAASAYTAQYFGAGQGTSNVCDPARLTSIATNEYWDVTKVSGSDASLTLDYTGANTWSNGGPDNTKVITIAHYNGTCWQDEALGSGVLPGTASSGQVTSKVMTSFSPFTFGLAPLTILPVHFTTLKATQKSNGIQVEWSNLTEADIVNYSIERSNNGRVFTSVATKTASKNDGSKADYQFLDASASSGDFFYRIKATETSGKIIFSNIVRINTGKSITDLVLYPNPVKGTELGIQISNLPAGKYTIKVFSAQGQELSSRAFSHNGGALTETISVSNLKTGIYNVQISGAVQLQKQFVVQ